MAYLYQEIQNVPGLSGSWQEKNAELYKNLGAPMGTYKGNLEQNLWLLNQIKKNNYFKDSQPWNQPKETQTQPQQTISEQYSAAPSEQLTGAAEVPQFENVISPDEAWSRIASGAMQTGREVLAPEIERQYNRNYYDYMNQMSSAGGGRLGRGRAGLGDLKAASERNWNATLQDWLGQQRQGFNELWYNPSREAWNSSRTQMQPDETLSAPKIPTWDEYQDKYGSAYGAGQGSSLFY
jgi:hypothetical protein